jgi:hypothetical protein
MIVEVNTNKELKNNIIDAAYFFAGKLIHSKSLNLIGVNVELADIGSVKEFHGFTDQVGPYDYTIVLNRSLGKKNLLTTLAHEMVHVKQMVKKELRHNKNGDLYWKKTLYENHENTLLDSPWELEAYDLEEQLYESYIKEGGLVAP